MLELCAIPTAFKTPHMCRYGGSVMGYTYVVHIYTSLKPLWHTHTAHCNWDREERDMNLRPVTHRPGLDMLRRVLGSKQRRGSYAVPCYFFRKFFPLYTTRSVIRAKPMRNILVPIVTVMSIPMLSDSCLMPTVFLGSGQHGGCARI